MKNNHSFHIPVLGLGYSADTPIKVSQFGIDSVIPITDDVVLEKLREKYCGTHELPYEEINTKDKDCRANRITSYLNLINKIAEKKFEELKNATIEKANEIREHFNMLPDSSTIKQEFKRLTAKSFDLNDIRAWIKDNLSIGSIDVNIMTKLDKENYYKGEKLPVEYNDAHSALRGYAKSDLSSSLVLSAGMSPRLYSYIEQFEDFRHDSKGKIKKKITLKVSDYRSALIQGKIFAKKGLWVSEYRIESGLNCGGHAFATDGSLLGPILNDFKNKREELIQSTHDVFVQTLEEKNLSIPETPLPIKITAQGGVGTAEEHQFLLDHYKLDSIGWGTPFLLVPEAVNVDEVTLKKLADSKEDDLYLSKSSPLGVPFANLKGNTMDIEKYAAIKDGKRGYPCRKKFLTYNTEFTERPICVASSQYQKIKIAELESQELATEVHQKELDKLAEKSCLCVGLSTTALLVNNIDTKPDGDGAIICPGQNMAYFSKIMSLKEITDHIYGRINVITRTDRPNLFINELRIYTEYLQEKLEEMKASITKKQKKYLSTFVKNLKESSDYYFDLFSEINTFFDDTKATVLNDLKIGNKKLDLLYVEIDNLL